MLRRVVAWVKRLLLRGRFNRKYATHHGVLEVTDEHVRLQRYEICDMSIALKTCWRFQWADVAQVTAYKVDMFAVDLMCIAFDLVDGTSFEVDEEMKGYLGIQEALERMLPGVEDDWWGKVAFPAFAANPTVVWTRGEDNALPDG